VPSLRLVLPLIRHHHERWDGSGYPDGLCGEQIPLEARLLQIADIYDALVSARPYKAACAPAQAMQILREETERGWRDPNVVALFVRLHESVIARIEEYTSGADHNLRTMKVSLDNLQDLLDSAGGDAD
jgi:putative two-component system response regulator